MFPNQGINKWIYVEKVDSTNKQLLDYSKNFPTTNILLYSFKQTQGNGQFGRSWYSGEDKNLTLSYFFPIRDLKPANQWILNCFVSVTLIQWLSRILPQKELKIKWPNDIYFDGQKLCGLLIQNSITTQQINNTIIGLGINVNEDSFPKDLPNPISFKQILKKSFNLMDLVTDLTLHFQQKLLDFNTMNIKFYKEIYHSHLYRIEELAQFKSDDLGAFMGKIKGVNDIGKLEIEVNDRVETFGFKELTFIT